MQHYLFSLFKFNDKQVLPKKKFRSALESEGYHIENSKKHANQLRIFSTELEVVS